MGGAKRIRPQLLGVKLKAVREYFDCSLAEMAGRLSDKAIEVNRTDISRFELGTREPNLILLLNYSKLIDQPINVLVDDLAELILK